MEDLLPSLPPIVAEFCPDLSPVIAAARTVAHHLIALADDLEDNAMPEDGLTMFAVNLRGSASRPARTEHVRAAGYVLEGTWILFGDIDGGKVAMYAERAVESVRVLP
jgi:hypothetical protein